MVNAKTKVVDMIRTMQKQRKEGRQIFYDIYTEEEKRRDPDKRDTGLFFFRGERNAPFAVVCAGGGFYYVGSVHESLPHALELSRRGYHGFALVYRTRAAIPSGAVLPEPGWRHIWGVTVRADSAGRSFPGPAL